MQNLVGIAQNKATNSTITGNVLAQNQLEGLTVDCFSNQCQVVNNQVGHDQAWSGAAVRSNLEVTGNVVPAGYQ